MSGKLRYLNPNTGEYEMITAGGVLAETKQKTLTGDDILDAIEQSGKVKSVNEKTGDVVLDGDNIYVASSGGDVYRHITQSNVDGTFGFVDITIDARSLNDGDYIIWDIGGDKDNGAFIKVDIYSSDDERLVAGANIKDENNTSLTLDDAQQYDNILLKFNSSTSNLDIQAYNFTPTNNNTELLNDVLLTKASMEDVGNMIQSIDINQFEAIDKGNHSFDTLKESGVYRLWDRSTSPSGSTDDYITVVFKYNDKITQVAHSSTTESANRDRVYIRSNRIGKWSDWREITNVEIEEELKTKADKEHTHSATDVRETSSRNFVTSSQLSDINTIPDKADKKHTHSANDITESYNRKFVSNSQLSDINTIPDKADKKHTHSANDITESYNRNFVSMDEKLKIQDIDDKADKDAIARTSTIVIANYDSHENSKKCADVVINIGEDAGEIMLAEMFNLGSTGGKIYLAEGNYNMDTSISIRKDNVTLEGSGMATIISNGYISIWGKNVTIKNLQIKNSHTYGVGLQKGSTSLIKDCIISNSSGGGIVAFDDAEGVICNNIIHNNNRHGVYLTGTSSVKCVNNTSYNNGENHCDIAVAGGSHIVINNYLGTKNNISGWGIYIWEKSVNSVVANNILIDNYPKIMFADNGQNTITELCGNVGV